MFKETQMAEPKRLFDIQLELLNVELKSIDGAIRQHDAIAMSVKNWAVVTWTASLGFSLKEPALLQFIGYTAVIPLVFWFVDGSFRRIQRTFIARVEQISAYLNSNEFKEAATTGATIGIPLLVMRHRTNRFKDSLIGTMSFRSVSLLYLGLALCSLAAWALKHG
jgi:hypothetical protein